MLQDEITLKLDHELDILVDEIQNLNVTVDVWPEAFETLDLFPEAVIYVDLESIGSGESIFRKFGKVARSFIFGKSVQSHKTTFAQLVFALQNTIQTEGQADINSGNHNYINVPIVVGKSVAAFKTTFGASSFVITDNIYVDGVNELGRISFYGSGLYGSGIYGEIGGYGQGLYGFGIYPSGTKILLAIGFGARVSAFKPVTETAVAEISLGYHGVPTSRSNHTINIRARTTSGSTGVIKAALYEGSTNRSGDLTTTPLTNSFDDYVLQIPIGSAAAITDYNNLSIRFWGYDSEGNALIFEIADIYLELPVSAGSSTYYGAVSSAISVNRTVSGIVSSKKTSTAEVSLASHGTPSARTNHTIKVRARTTSGSTGTLRAGLYEGSTLRSGVLETSILTNSLADYSLSIPEASANAITDYSNLSIRFWGFDSEGYALVFEVSNIYLELPTT